LLKDMLINRYLRRCMFLTTPSELIEIEFGRNLKLSISVIA